MRLVTASQANFFSGRKKLIGAAVCKPAGQRHRGYPEDLSEGGGLQWGAPTSYCL